MAFERSEALLIPDLQQRVVDLTRALRAVVDAADDMSFANRREALRTARRVLESGNIPEFSRLVLHRRG